MNLRDCKELKKMIDNYELTDNVPDEVRYAILSNKKFINMIKKDQKKKSL